MDPFVETHRLQVRSCGHMSQCQSVTKVWPQKKKWHDAAAATFLILPKPWMTRRSLSLGTDRMSKTAPLLDDRVRSLRRFDHHNSARRCQRNYGIQLNNEPNGSSWRACAMWDWPVPFLLQCEYWRISWFQTHIGCPGVEGELVWWHRWRREKQTV